jgi:hypothetical protein
MDRISVINALIKQKGYKTYLEIGTRSKHCYVRINCDYKCGIDPSEHAMADHYITSDEFFKKRPDGDFNYDIIFIDGLHYSQQVYRDVINSFNTLSEDGTIIMHDCLPPGEKNQVIPQQVHSWMGDVWKALYFILNHHENIDVSVHNFDCGVGILKNKKPNNIMKFHEDYLEIPNMYNYKEDFEKYLKRL